MKNLEGQKLKSYRRNEIDVEAMQVKRPYRNVSKAFPRSHQHDRPSGRLNYFRLTDAPEGRNRAQEGDWIIKHPNGKIEVVSAEEFEDQYDEL